MVTVARVLCLLNAKIKTNQAYKSGHCAKNVNLIHNMKLTVNAMRKLPVLLEASFISGVFISEIGQFPLLFAHDK